MKLEKYEIENSSLIWIMDRKKGIFVQSLLNYISIKLKQD